MKSSADAGQRRKGVLFTDDQFVVRVGYVAFDFVVEYQIGYDALRLVQIDVLHLHEFQGFDEGFDRDLVRLHQQTPATKTITKVIFSFDVISVRW